MNLLNLKASPVLRFLTSLPKKPDEPAVDPKVMDAVRDLISNPKWPLYKSLLDIRISKAVEAMLASTEDSQVHYFRGYVTGLMHSAQIPESLAAQEDHVNRRKQRRAADADRRTDAARDATFATEYWGN